MPTKEFDAGTSYAGKENESGEIKKSAPVPREYIIETGIINVSDLEHEIYRVENEPFYFGVDINAYKEFEAIAQPRCGKETVVEVHCECDGDPLYLTDLINTLRRIGCTNIKTRSEDVENPNPWWKCVRYAATGIMWNTNNWRKMHGLPMKRRARK